MRGQSVQEEDLLRQILPGLEQLSDRLRVVVEAEKEEEEDDEGKIDVDHSLIERISAFAEANARTAVDMLKKEILDMVPDWEERVTGRLGELIQERCRLAVPPPSSSRFVLT